VEDCTQDEDCGTRFLCKATGGRTDVPNPVECAGPCSTNADCTSFGGGSCSSGACTNQCSTVGTNKCSSGHYRADATLYNSTLTECPDMDAGQRFLKLTGDNITVAGLNVRGFFEGVHFAGENGSFIDGELTRQCDDSITNEADLGIGSLVKNSYIAESCDKGTQDYAGPTIPGGCSGNGCWHITYDGVVFEGAKQALRVTDDDVYIRVKNSTVHTFGTGSDNSSFWCQQSKFDGKDVVSSIENSELKFCESGFVFGGSQSQHDVLDSNVHHNVDRGIDMRGSDLDALKIGATVDVRRTKIRHNGGHNGSSPLGGVTVSAEGFATLATTNSDANEICDNKKGDGTQKQVNDIRSSGSTINAEYNWWGSATGPSGVDITGNVDYSPYRTTKPFSTTNCDY
jgi:hypothetical protein